MLGERGLELLVLEVDVDGATRREVARQDLGHAPLERGAGAGADAHDLVDRPRIEPGLHAHHERFGDRHQIDLNEHVVDELHR